MTTRQEHILIHLYGQIGYGNSYEMPYRTTQDGIAEAVGISRGQVSVEIRRLEDKGFTTSKGIQRQVRRMILRCTPSGVHLHSSLIIA